jgi:thiamine biosynthesis protein ThiS
MPLYSSSSARRIVEPLEVPAGCTIERLLDIMGETVRQDMIVELNHRFIHLRDYSTTTVNEGDNVEMIHLAFCG